VPFVDVEDALSPSLSLGMYVNCGPLYPDRVGSEDSSVVFGVYEEVAAGDVTSEVASGCAGDSVEDGDVFSEEPGVGTDVSEVSTDVSVASGMKEVERTVSSDCVTIGFPSGST
jgi:hypothetical protein